MKVLIVDDERVSRSTIRVFTQKMGYTVLEASDGLTAFDIWKDERPQLVITDWNMPKMDGRALCRKIREEEGEDYTYIIIVTGRHDNEDVVAGMKAGADDYMVKPLNRDELSVRIKAGIRVLNLQSKDVVIFALAKLAESRDEDTGQHLERVRYYSKAIGDELLRMPDPPPELDKQVVANIFLTSPLHDIGKVGIPDFVLLKPGRLDDKEFALMKNHAYIGFKTLDEAVKKNPRANYLKVAAEIAHHHHEKWDGTGYPDGLKGDEIHISSRIFAIADVYDALVSKRPYKEPFSADRAKAIIVDGKGSHFDPQVVDAFLNCEKEFLKIQEKYGG